MSKKIKLKSKIMGLGLALIAPASLAGGLMLSQPAPQADSTSYITEWSDNTIAKSKVTSNSFAISGTYSEGNNLSGWSAIDYDTISKGMIIDVGGTSFNNNQNQYNLSNNPGKYSGQDNKILMINSKHTSSAEPHSAKRGYQSSKFTLDANSYYRISVDASTSLDGFTDVNHAYGSIYLTEHIEDNSETIMAFEGISGSWATYNFFIATGDEAKEVSLDLYLGKSNSEGSFGVAFYDEVVIEQFSQNAFIADCLTNGYAYTDNFDSSADIKTKFMVEELVAEDSALMQNFADYNFDFEDEVQDNGLTAQWKVKNDTSNAHAIIYDVTSAGQMKFESADYGTGYNFVGNDLSYNMTDRKENTQALALYTNKGTSGKITAYNTKAIPVQAHAIYKINLKAKVSEMTEGSFYVNLVENDTLLATYGLDAKDITLGNGSTSGFSSNSTNNITNNYTDITFYVKGRNFYDSFVNLELSLGNDTTNASGCVIIDNITIDYATSADAEGADNFLDLETLKPTLDFKNSTFNATEVKDSEFKYPLYATDWTLTQPQNVADDVVAGIVYLYNDATYDSMYKETYDWATSYPGNPEDLTDAPNNVYMLHNGSLSYQSVKSSSYTLSADKYYSLTFDYYTMNKDINKDAQITVEVVDADGIVLYKEKLASTNNVWSRKVNPVNIQFHTALTSSHDISVIIHFGTENDEMIGTAYIDNFNISESSKEVFAISSRTVDLTDYMLNLDPNNSIGYNLSDSNAYSFSSNTTDSMVGGIVSGESNEYGVTYEGKNILVLSSRLSPSTGTIKSIYTFKLDTTTKYYKLTFDLKTDISERPNADYSNEEDHDCAYGVKIGLTNFDLIKNLKSNEDFTSYTIYFEASSEQTSNLEFSLVMDKHYEGSAYLTNINFESSTEEIYADAKESNNFGETVFTSKVAEADNADTETPEEDAPAGNGNFNSQNWILIPSIITGVAVIVAIIGWLLRHIKIKKIEKIKQESYDRKVSVDKDIVNKKAVAERDAELEQIKANIAELEEQKQILEQEHKANIKEARLSSKGQVTKETEREFKSYASKLSRLQQKIDILNEQLVKVNKPEYIGAIERRLVSEEARRQKEAFKAHDEKIKAEKKASKKSK